MFCVTGSFYGLLVGVYLVLYAFVTQSQPVLTWFNFRCLDQNFNHAPAKFFFSNFISIVIYINENLLSKCVIFEL